MKNRAQLAKELCELDLSDCKGDQDAIRRKVATVIGHLGPYEARAVLTASRASGSPRFALMRAHSISSQSSIAEM
jgi:hypothetical protein